MDPRTRRLLEGPIAPTLLRLALPNMLVMFVQASIGLIETYFVAGLGTDVLAGMALVFPVLMLIQMISAGAMGGGILSAVSRALGAGRRDRAGVLVWHAVFIACGLGLLTSAVLLAAGTPCPSSEFLRQKAVGFKGGFGSSGLQIMRLASGAASDGFGWSVV